MDDELAGVLAREEHVEGTRQLLETFDHGFLGAKLSLPDPLGELTDPLAEARVFHIAPEAALSAARDVYINRIEANLGALEDRLSESRIKFVARSLFGAAALAMTPMAAPAVAEAAATFGVQTINYRFSREKLLQEHPYSYLHRLGKADFVIPKRLERISVGVM